MTKTDHFPLSRGNQQGSPLSLRAYSVFYHWDLKKEQRRKLEAKAVGSYAYLLCPCRVTSDLQLSPFLNWRVNARSAGKFAVRKRNYPNIKDPSKVPCPNVKRQVT